jgi:DUF2892 family protein
MVVELRRGDGADAVADQIRGGIHWRSAVMTLEPMLRAIAGTFVAASVLLGIFVHPYVLWFTLFVGLNLLQSGFTNWCPMISFLRRLGVREAA